MDASIHDRDSISALYPPEDFARDAGANADPQATVLRGVLVERGADAEGRFAMRPATRHVAEAAEAGTAPFVAAQLVTAASAAGEVAGCYDGAPHGGAAAAKPGRTVDYERFLDVVILAAQRISGDASPGRHDERLYGPRQ